MGAASVTGTSGWWRVARLLKVERADVVTIVIYASMLGLLALVIPLTVQTLVNTVAFGNLIQPFVVVSVLLLIVLLFAAFLKAMQSIVAERVQQRLFVRFTTAMVDRLLLALARSDDGVTRREAADRIFDVFLVQKSVSTLLLDTVGLVLQTGIGLVVLAFYHPYLFAFGLLLAASIAGVLVAGRGGSVSADYESKKKYLLAGWLNTVANEPIKLRGSTGHQLAVARAEALADEYLEARRDHFRVVLRQIVGSLAVQVIASAGLLGLGGWLVVEQQLTLGQLIAAELIVSLVVDNVAKMGKHLEAYFDLQASLGKLEKVLLFPIEPPGTRPLPFLSEPMRIELRDVVLRSGVTVSCAVEPGGRLVVSGASGTGKTSLLRAIFDLSTNGGQIYYDEVEARGLERISVRSQIAFVADEEPLPLSVADNLTLGDEKISVAELERALRIVGLAALVHRMPEGLDTSLAPGLLELSSGERRRLSLARALLQRPRLLLIDGWDGLELGMLEGCGATILIASDRKISETFQRLELAPAEEVA